MSCNSAIHVANQTPVKITTTAGTWVQVPLGSAVRRFGNALRADGGSILCFCPGYFDTKCFTLVGMPRNCGRDCNSILTIWVDNSCTVEAVSAVVEKE